MCWYCGSPVTDAEPLGRSLRCAECGKDLRACKNCRHYRPGGCAESEAETPREPERANFCDWFSLNPLFRNRVVRQPNELSDKSNLSLGEKNSGGKKLKEAAAEARSAFDDLFNLNGS